MSTQFNRAQDVMKLLTDNYHVSTGSSDEDNCDLIQLLSSRLCLAVEVTLTKH